LAIVNPLARHQLAWLAAHPYRSEEWLRAVLADGFDVHHADGDHSNDDPRNLVLIERTDHMALHGAGAKRLAQAVKSARRVSPERLEIGRRVYEAKEPGMSWRRAGIAAGMKLDRYKSAQTAKLAADAYATAAGLPLIVHCPVKDNSALS